MAKRARAKGQQAERAVVRLGWGKRALSVIEDRGLSRRSVESRAGMTENTLSAAINADMNIRVDNAVRLAETLGVSLDWLFRGIGEREPETAELVRRLDRLETKLLASKPAAMKPPAKRAKVKRRGKAGGA